MDMQKMLIQSIINAQAPINEFYESITNLEEMHTVDISPSVLSLIYVPCQVLTIGSDYYLVHNGKVVYGGHIDSEGLIDTVIKDITTLSDFINFGIAARLGDEVKLMEFLSDQELMTSLLGQISLGYSYYQQNHGNKPIC
jgi:hypothetical protein